MQRTEDACTVVQFLLVIFFISLTLAQSYEIEEPFMMLYQYQYI